MFQLKSYQQAESEYRHAVELAPTDFYAHLYLGDTLFHLRRFTQAADAGQEAIRINPEHFGARFSRGYSLMAAFQFAEAIPDLEKAHQLKKENKWARYVLFGAYFATSQFKKAYGLYPLGFGLAGAALLISFGLGAALLLKKSFEVSYGESPGLGFSVCWVLIYFEGQIACIFMAGLFGLTFASGSIVVGMVAAPIPLLIAAIAAFPDQIWGAPFARPRPFPWKWVGAACLALVLINVGDAGYVKLITEITHKSLPSPRNLQFIEEMIKSHPALAVFAGVILWPMAEEVLFRGLLFGALQKWLSTGWTILTTAIVFAAIHADPVYFLPLIVLGLLFGWVRNKTGSVWISAVIHILNNALGFAALALGQGT